MTPATKSRIEELKGQAQATPHSDKCCCSSPDPFEHVFGKQDPDCPRCALNREASRIVAADMF